MNSEVVALKEAIGVCPQTEIAAGKEHARELSQALVDEFVRHLRQRAAFSLSGPFISEFQPIERGAVLGIKPRQTQAGFRVLQALQQLQRVALLRDVTQVRTHDIPRSKNGGMSRGCGSARSAAAIWPSGFATFLAAQI